MYQHGFCRGKIPRKSCKGNFEEVSELRYTHDTFGRDIQLGAARERLKDAEALHHGKRCTGAIYMGGYAIECSLKALICSQDHKDNFKDTGFYEKHPHGSLHDLNRLLNYASKYTPLKNMVTYQEPYKSAWSVITQFWQKDELRYWNKLEDTDSSERFLASVKKIYALILHQLERR
jgi:hypothetical protein